MNLFERGLTRALLVAVAFCVVAVVALSTSSGSRAARRAFDTVNRSAHTAVDTGTLKLDRYSIVNGCYTLSSPTGTPIAAADGPFRMQAAALGIYLLYTPHDQYLVDAGASGMSPAATPSQAAEWTITGDSAHGFTLTNGATGVATPASLTPASGCATYPEAQVGATGKSFAGPSPEGTVSGTVEGHSHITAFELFGGDYHCGRPWSPYGAPFALPASCTSDEQGTNGVFEAFLDFGGVTRPGAMNGWPTFKYWPSPTAISEEGDYYTGIERAWKAGLRVMVSNDVDNEVLCSLMTTRRSPCNDMSSVVLQSADLHALQNYIDAQSGGPGKGWFRLVTNPFQARRVVNQGKLAVIQGIEVSRLFGCGEMEGKPQCGTAQVDAGLAQVWKLGVRTFFPVHEFNNAFGGTKGISGSTGLIVNAGNRDATGSFMTEVPCPAADADAEQLSTAPTGALASLLNGPLATILDGNATPVYGTGPTCNTQGLTDLGAYLINDMIRHHVIIQLDHMDSKTAASALAIATAHHYSGVVSAHCCSSPQLFQQIYADGGFVTEPAAPASAFVTILKQDEAMAGHSATFGFGYGSDMNGLAEQPGPASATPISYPFKAYRGNVTFGQEVWGDRTFNLNTDGVANYGMYADWLNDIQRVGGNAAMAAMFRGAEGYLDMWERTWGVPGTRCQSRSAAFGAAGLGRTLHLGETATAALYSAGQPVSRPGASYRYCVTGSPGTALAAVFTGRQRVGLIGSRARGYRAGGVAPGARITRLTGTVRIAPGLYATPPLKHGARYVYGVAGGRVRFVGLAAASELSVMSHLRATLRSAGL